MDRRPEPDESPPEPQDASATPAEVKLGLLDDYIAFHLRQAQNASFKAFQRQTGEPDLRPGWFAVLALIDVNPGITPILLSRASGRDKSTLTPVLRDLTQRNLICRTPVAHDKRSYALALTDAGREKLKTLAAHAAIHDRKLDEIAGPKKADLLVLLRRISALLD